MKKSISLNIQGSVFLFDENASVVLSNYIENLKLFFKEYEDADEIIRDIEYRISELLFEKNDKKHEFTEEEVVKVIETIGKPDDFDSEKTEEKNNLKSSEETEEQSNLKPSKKLYRDLDNGWIGGVASGLAEHFNLPVTIFRLAFIFAAFLSYGLALLIYIFLWISLPKVNSIVDALKVKGREINIDSISKFDHASNNINNLKDSLANKIDSHFQGALSSSIKFLLTTVFFLVACVLIVMILRGFSYLLNPGPFGYDLMFYPVRHRTFNIISSSIIVVFVVSICIYFFYRVFNLIKRDGELSRLTSLLVASILFLIACSMLCFMLTMYIIVPLAINEEYGNRYIIEPSFLLAKLLVGESSSIVFVSMIIITSSISIFLFYTSAKMINLIKRPVKHIGKAVILLVLLSMSSIIIVLITTSMDFRFVQTIKETVPLTANEKSLIVKWEPIPRQDEVIGRLHYFPSQDDDTVLLYLYETKRVHINRIKDDQPRLEIYKSARARNDELAISRVKEITYRPRIIDDTLVLPSYIECPSNSKWRAQQIKLVLNVPEDWEVQALKGRNHISLMDM